MRVDLRRRLPVTGRLAVSNARDTPMRYVLEPWGDVATIRVGEAATLDLCGPESLDMEIELQNGGVTVWVDEGSPCVQSGTMFVVDRRKRFSGADR